MADPTKKNQNEIFLLEAWVLDNPGSHLFLKLAQLYHKENRLAEAAGVLQRGLAIHPKEVEARGLLAEVLQAMGDLPGAVNQLQIAAREIKRHSAIFTRLADFCELQGDQAFSENARQIAQALEGDSPTSPRIDAPGGEDTVTMAEIYAAQGYTDQAAGIYRRLLSKEPGRSDLQSRLDELESGFNQKAAAQIAIEKLNAFKQAALAMN
jgi:tetratricopeptide (TPR) repeat protein